MDILLRLTFLNSGTQLILCTQMSQQEGKNRKLSKTARAEQQLHNVLSNLEEGKLDLVVKILSAKPSLIAVATKTKETLLYRAYKLKQHKLIDFIFYKAQDELNELEIGFFLNHVAFEANDWDMVQRLLTIPGSFVNDEHTKHFFETIFAFHENPQSRQQAADDDEKATMCAAKLFTLLANNQASYVRR